jgi:cytochrome P450
MNPAFQFEAIRHCTEVFKQMASEVLKRWDNERREGPIEVASWMTRFTIDSLGKFHSN